jgi:hypothetical protein
MQLSKSERFIKEYEEFKAKIAKVPDPKKQTELTALLNQMLAEVRAIDNKHSEISMMGRLPEAVNDLRDNLTSIRKNLVNRLQGYENN